MTEMFLRNRYLTRSVSHDKSLHQVWTGKKPLLANLKVFGCHAYITFSKGKRTKFDVLSDTHSDREKAYRFKELESCRVLVSRDANFMENVFDTGKRDYSQQAVVIENEESHQEEEEEEEETARDCRHGVRQ